MKAERMMIEAKLWDVNALVGRARAWCESQKGEWFLELKPSQLSALERAVTGARGPEEFQRDLWRFASDAADRGKKKTVWTREHVTELAATFQEALSLARKSTGQLATAYEDCKRKLEIADAAKQELDGDRDEAVLRAYLAALSMLRRSREKAAAGEAK